MTQVASERIVGFRIAENEEVEEGTSTDSVVLDESPLTKRIENRPEGSLEGVNHKFILNTTEGPKKLYIGVGFVPVVGMVDGESVVIERPCEFFFPPNQLDIEEQFVTALMRSLSMAARGGYLAQNLSDLRKITSHSGVVRCRREPDSKMTTHDSVVAALAWQIQQILIMRGFLKDNGKEATLEELIENYRAKSSPGYNPVGDHSNEKSPERVKVDNCPECSGDMYMAGDGCPMCEDCGFSKCG